jgi:hypothetical protein
MAKSFTFTSEKNEIEQKIIDLQETLSNDALNFSKHLKGYE